MGRVSTGSGYMIGYREHGSGDAAPIVFLHGVGSDKSVWHPQLDYFAVKRRAIAFDYPGYGDSDPASPETSRDDYAQAIIFALRELGIHRAHVCGLSLGGVVAIAIHHAQPSMCQSLVLADTFARHPEGQAIHDRSIAGSEDLGAMAEARVDVLLAQPSDPDVRQEVVTTMSNIDPAAYRIGSEAVWLADQRDRAKAIAVPTLVIVGSEDRVTPKSLSDELVQLVPGAQIAVIEGAGHLANLEEPTTFNRLVDRFLTWVEEVPSHLSRS